MSDEQLHSLDEHDLVAEWKEDGVILSPEGQLETINNLTEVKQNTDEAVDTFKKLPRQTDEATGAARRAELRQQIAEQERYEEQYGDTKALIQNIQTITRQYDPEYLEAAAKIIEKHVLEDTKTIPEDGFAETKVKYAVRMALGLSPLTPMHQEEGEQ